MNNRHRRIKRLHLKHAKGLLEIMPPKIGWSVDFSQPFGTQSVNNTEWECPKFDTEGKNDMQVPIRINPKNSGRKFREPKQSRIK